MADQYVLAARVTGDASSFDAAIDNVEKKLGSLKKNAASIGKALSDVGGALTKGITIPAIGAATALAGITLSKGWDRMASIDNARAKLNAVIKDADLVALAMDNALASVKGTAFGMDEAATTAASAVAAGIKPGKELDRYLSLVADSAAVAGTSMSDMGAIWNKVSSMGKANNEVLQQMAESGIPIYQWLAEEAGTTADAIFDMASRGEIDLAMFESAVEKHIGGAAKEMGSTTISAAIANIGADISRIGAALLGSSDDASTAAGKLLEQLNRIRGGLAIVEEKAKEMAPYIGQAFDRLVAAGERVFAFFEKLGPKGSAALAGVAVGIGPALLGIGKLITGYDALMGAMIKVANGGGLIGKAMGTVLKFMGPITAGIAIFAALYASSEKFRAAVNGLVGTLVTGLVGTFQALWPILQTVLAVFWQMAGVIGDALAPVVTAIGSIFQTVFASIIAVIQNIAPSIIGLVQIAAMAISGIIKVVTPIISFIAGTIAKIISIITPIAKVAANIVGGILAAVTVTIGGIVAAFMAMKTKVVSVFNAIKGAWQKVTSAVATIAGGITSAFTEMVGKVKSIFNKFTGAINSAIGVINKIPGVDIPKIPALARGTDNWSGGFAQVNERGGELMNLPNGTQVIPHDLSERYAKESARANAGAGGLSAAELYDIVLAAVGSASGEIREGMAEAVDGMRIDIDRRSFGRIVNALQ